MPGRSRSKPKIKSLSAGRSSIAKRDNARFSAKAGRTIIRSHHQLNKRLQEAEQSGNNAEATALRSQIESLGGLQQYQQASLLGQSNARGGDSSKALVDWLRPHIKDQSRRLTLLEIGALSTTNACSQWSTLDVTSIDLNSQGAGILQQDFMLRPLPRSDKDKFDIISLSLVLNFVPSKEGRGEMLQRIVTFLNNPDRAVEKKTCILPALFMVLPAPCVTNSRYMTEKHLEAIMNSLGFHLGERKLTSKLVYYLWSFSASDQGTSPTFKKEEINPGPGRNNFSIVL